MLFCQIRVFYRVLFAMQKRRYLRWFRAPVENHTIYMNLSCSGGLLAGCCVDGLGWLGWAGWVELAGFAGGLCWLPAHLQYLWNGFLEPWVSISITISKLFKCGSYICEKVESNQMCANVQAEGCTLVNI